MIGLCQLFGQLLVFFQKKLLSIIFSNYFYNKNMLSAPASPKKCNNPKVETLIFQINQTERNSEIEKDKKVQEARKIYHSSSLGIARRMKMSKRPLFNNKTKDGEFIDKEVKPIPYHFIPAFKNNTFIMPDRVLEKGEAAKRLVIKMKDSSIFSFRNTEDEATRRSIRKQQKQRTIVSRQVEQYNRIIDLNDGKKRTEINKWFMKNRKRFYPTNTTSDFFSEQEPMLEPKDAEAWEMRKTNLERRFKNDSKWRPFTRGSQSFGASVSSSLYSNQRQIYSVR